jgi:ferric-dicitrate binding protein FerR (iron transport regulator)
LVPFGSKTKVILPDSSTVWLNAGTRLRYPANFDDNLRHVFLQGEGFFDVTKDSQYPFIVNSNGLNIKVLGTKFNLKANASDNFIEATLIEGAIEILGLKDNIDHQSDLVLKPGQKLTLRKENDQYEVQNIQEAGLFIPEEDATPVKIKSADLHERANVELVTAWTDNKLVFVKERFGDVKTKLERWYGVTIEVKDPEILDYRFTGTFEKQTFEQAMNALSKAASCKYKIDKNHVVVSK